MWALNSRYSESPEKDRSKDSHVLNIRLIIHQAMNSMIRVANSFNLQLDYELDHQVGLVATQLRDLG